MKNPLAAVLLTGTLFGSGLAVSAQIFTQVFDSLGNGSGGTSVVDDGRRHHPQGLGQSFSTGAAVNLTEVTLLLQRDSTPTGALAILLYASDLGDNGLPRPHVVLADIGTLDDTALTVGLSAYTFDLAAPYALAANTRYWVALGSSPSKDTPTSAQWSYSVDDSGLGAAAEYYDVQGGVFLDSDGPFQMRVNVTPLVAVPEPGFLPSGFVAAGAGVLAVFALRRKSPAN